MTDSILTLWCLLHGQPTSFSVEVDRAKTVDYLKKTINDELKLRTASAFLTLWRVSIPDDMLNSDITIDTLHDKTGLFNPKTLLSRVFPESPDDNTYIFIQGPSEAPSSSAVDYIPLKRLPAEDDRNVKRARSHITTAGPVQWSGPSLMLPFTERSLFEEVRRGICSGNSFVVHGPYQSGKTSFLMAMQAELEKNPVEAAVVYFDISDLGLPSDTQDEVAVLDMLSRFWSLRVFRQKLSWEDLTAKLQELPPSPRHYVLVDEFQSVFRSSILLNAAKKFFRNLSSKTAVSYVAVGTFKLMELLLADGKMESPFNKAVFAGMPPFDLREMGRLFDLYKMHCDTDGITRQIQDKVVHESGGHPASFMVLLKLILQHHPDENSWASLLQANIGSLLNGTQTKLRTNLKSMNTEQQSHVRDLTKNQLEDWEFTPDDFNRYLLDIGVLDSSNDRTVRFTSGIILRICIDAVWPQPEKRLSKKEIGDPINMLKLGLQCISPSTVADPLVRNKHGPQECGFQVALFSALNGLLPRTMMCLFEAKAKNKDRIDLMLTENGQKLFGYELKVNAISQPDFKDHLQQASKYAVFYDIPVYLVNFYLEGHSTPVPLLNIPANVFVVNIMHNKDCTRFIIAAPNGDKTTVNTNESPSGGNNL
ncbi:hypothetical protein EMPS_03069 [Entomortierella parvispora]|uniref:Crinkler effector protein N-terminal domain-containing protein n=1 Tax=Entomortierella parvispora TaxID=205924 RepID=A0A9P3LUA0_9FUNG|nr:hypothetical protein EMPS_03069 [Entomortierella parvispora]